MGPEGYSDGRQDVYCSDIREVINADYTACFDGTSASAPLTAGVAGLIISASSCSLTPKQVRFLLQDCADKIEPLSANYSPKNGFSMGNAESNNQSTHGYGRLNAYEAVKIISSDISKGGHNGVDIFVRDNYLDWGNTEQPSSTLLQPERQTISSSESVDIKIDVSGQEPVFTNDQFENTLRDERPLGGRSQKVYVRVRNRGCRPANNVTVKLYWVH